MKSKLPAGKIIKDIAKLFSLKKESMQLQFIRVTEKFDVVKRSSYKGWVLRLDSE